MNSVASRRVLHVVHGFPPEVIGGTEAHVERLALAQRDGGHDARVFSGSLEWRDHVAIEDGEHRGIPVRRVHRSDLYFDRWDKGYQPEVSRAFAAYLKEFAPQVVHVHHWIRLSTDLVALAARAGIPAVVTLHDLYPSCPRVFRLKGVAGDEACEVPLAKAECTPCVERWRFDRDDDVAASLASYRADMRGELSLARARIAPSRTHAEFLARMLELDLPIDVIAHGRLHDPLPKAAIRAPDGTLRIGCFGHLQPLKGPHLLIEAVKRATSRDRIAVEFWGAAVDADYESRLRAAAEGLRVSFRGKYQRDQLSTVALDAIVLPTLCRESWSYVLDEAFDLGLPIVAARAGALAERATGRDALFERPNGRDALFERPIGRVALFERNDPDSLARVLDELATSPARLAEMRAAPASPAPAFSESAAAIFARYEAAIAAGPPILDGAATAALDARAIEQFRRREAYFRELVRIEKWEDVVGDLRARIAALEAELRSRP